MTRQAVSAVNWNLCIICQKRTNQQEQLHQVSTKDTESTMKNIADNYYVLNCRVAELDLSLLSEVSLKVLVQIYQRSLVTGK